MNKLDFETKLFLFIIGAKVKNVNSENILESQYINKREVYIFDNYLEYKKIFLNYFDDVREDLIDLAILTRGKNGQIIAFKGLVERIIAKKTNIGVTRKLLKK